MGKGGIQGLTELAPGNKGAWKGSMGIHGKGFPLHAIFFERERKKRGLFPRLFAGLHLVHVVVDILEDIDPAGPEFIEKKPFPLGRQEFFQQNVAGSQVGGDDDFPHLIDFRGQGFQLHRRSLLKKQSMGWDGRDKTLIPIILNNKNSSRSSA